MDGMAANPNPMPGRPPMQPGHNGRPTTPGWRGEPAQAVRDSKLNQSPKAIYRKRGA